MASIQYYSFWLWQYEVRSEKPLEEKTFRNHNYADPNTVNVSASGTEFTNKIPQDLIIQAIINNEFTPCGPSISSEISARSCLKLSKGLNESNLFIAIKYNAPLEKLIPEMKMLIAMQRQWAVTKKIEITEEDRIKAGLEATLIYQQAEEELNAYFVKDKPNIHKEGAQRALGLWLFDYCQKRSCGCPTAYAALEKTGYLEKLNYGKKDSKNEERHFARLLKNARDCIAACEVLPIGG
jgi:hypothetical protein